jgi:hypothetical protein
MILFRASTYFLAVRKVLSYGFRNLTVYLITPDSSADATILLWFLTPASL